LASAYAHDVEPLSDVTLQGLSFIDVTAGAAEFRRVQFNNCQFVGVDLQDAVFDECEAETSSFYVVKLNDASRMGIQGLHPGINVRNIHHEPSGDVYAPVSIASLLERLGVA